MRNPFESREIWFLTGSQGLYGPETLDQVAEQSRTIASTLDAGSDIPVKIVWKPVLTDRDAIRDRKSTRLNSSHVAISYAVFCLKKKIATQLWMCAGIAPDDGSVER